MPCGMALCARRVVSLFPPRAMWHTLCDTTRGSRRPLQATADILLAPPVNCGWAGLVAHRMGPHALLRPDLMRPPYKMEHAASWPAPRPLRHVPPRGHENSAMRSASRQLSWGCSRHRDGRSTCMISEDTGAIAIIALRVLSLLYLPAKGPSKRRWQHPHPSHPHPVRTM